MLLGLDAVRSAIHAQESVISGSKQSKAQKIPKNIAEAIHSNDPDLLAQFILKHPRKIAKSNTKQKIKMLNIIKVRTKDPGGFTQIRLVVRENYERAALIVLREAENNPSELKEVINSIGGKNWLKTNERLITNQQLREITNKAIR